MLKNLRKGDRYANCKIKAMCIHEGSHTAAGGVQRRLHEGTWRDRKAKSSQEATLCGGVAQIRPRI